MVQRSAYAAELIGTFILVFFGTLSVTIAVGLLNAENPVLHIAVAHGIALMIAVYAFGRISGAHVNPAVTIGMALLRKITPRTAAGYIIVQLIGATLAVAMHALFLPAGSATAFGATLPTAAIGENVFIAMALEAVLTFVLMTVILHVTARENEYFGVAIGATLGAAILVAGPLTGAALNPARAFGPALMSGAWTAQLAYWIGPIVGAVIAAGVYALMTRNESKGRR